MRRQTLGVLGAGYGYARSAYSWLTEHPPGGAQRWTRTNHRGEPVTLLEGPAVALACAGAVWSDRTVPVPLKVAATVAALGAGAFGVYDDLAEQGTSKGLAGHLGELRRGRVTTGGLKVIGIGATGLLAAALARPGASSPAAAALGAGGASRAGGPSRAGGALDVLTGAALVAGTANLTNLFDLRPGRAIKVTLLHAPALLGSTPAASVTAAACGAAAALLGEDLGERAMLGDGGANALGAVIGTGLVAAASRRTRLGLLGGVVALTLASEKVSFSKVIAATPGLREFDLLGRRPAPS